MEKDDIGPPVVMLYQESEDRLPETSAERSRRQAF